MDENINKEEVSQKEKISVLPAFIITFVCMLAFLVMPYGKVAAQLADRYV